MRLVRSDDGDNGGGGLLSGSVFRSLGQHFAGAAESALEGLCVILLWCVDGVLMVCCGGGVFVMCTRCQSFVVCRCVVGCR